jgi:hypothetical protein
LHKNPHRWEERIKIEGKTHFIGYYKSEEEAAVDYARAVFKYKGQGRAEGDLCTQAETRVFQN